MIKKDTKKRQKKTGISGKRDEKQIAVKEPEEDEGKKIEENSKK